jgi:endonuclease YncB( thermonuclease family)
VKTFLKLIVALLLIISGVIATYFLTDPFQGTLVIENHLAETIEVKPVELKENSFTFRRLDNAKTYTLSLSMLSSASVQEVCSLPLGKSRYAKVADKLSSHFSIENIIYKYAGAIVVFLVFAKILLKRFRYIGTRISQIRCPEVIPTSAIKGRIVKVIDGDSIVVRFYNLNDDGSGLWVSREVRIEKIDAPEIGQRCGIIAKHFLQRILHGNEIHLLLQKDKDAYNRLLASVYCKGRNIGREMVANGLAWVHPSAKEDSYVAAQNKAKDKSLGLWKNPKPAAPWDFRKWKSRNR